MKKIKQTVSPIGSRIFRNVAALATFWLTGLIFVRISRQLSEGWASSDVAIIVAALLGIVVALRISARLAAYFWASQVAFGVSELIIHSIYGIKTVQGGPTHFAVMGAGAFGVLFGLYMGRWNGQNTFGKPARPDTSVIPGSEATGGENQMLLNHPLPGRPVFAGP